MSTQLLAGRSVFPYNSVQMKKDAPLAFRIRADLKKKLQRLAKDEARSLSQVCELLLAIGVEEYDREGRVYLQKILSRAGRDNAS